MDFSWRFDRWFRRLPASPRDRGRVHRVVLRPPGKPGERATPEVAELDPELGLVGDRWSEKPREDRGSQVSLINVHVLRDLARGEERMALSGDNLHVDLELSEANLPAGTQLRVGTAVLEVSPTPHRPCEQFIERYGSTAAKRVSRAARIGLRGRGMLCFVAEAGQVRVGDALVVQRPSDAQRSEDAQRPGDAQRPTE